MLNNLAVTLATQCRDFQTCAYIKIHCTVNAEGRTLHAFPMERLLDVLCLHQTSKSKI
jgi:hypothetical protein